MGRSVTSSFLALLAGVQSATLEMKLGLLTDALERRYRPDQPRAPAGTSVGGQWVEDRVRVAISSPRCDGFSGGCQSGGTYGTTGWIKIGGRRLCLDCAVKLLGIETLPRDEQLEILRGFDPGIR
jgi:hypothetical protein